MKTLHLFLHENICKRLPFLQIRRRVKKIVSYWEKHPAELYEIINRIKI